MYLRRMRVSSTRDSDAGIKTIMSPHAYGDITHNISSDHVESLVSNVFASKSWYKNNGTTEQGDISKWNHDI